MIMNSALLWFLFSVSEFREYFKTICKYLKFLLIVSRYLFKIFLISFDWTMNKNFLKRIRQWSPIKWTFLFCLLFCCLSLYFLLYSFVDLVSPCAYSLKLIQIVHFQLSPYEICLFWIISFCPPKPPFHQSSN